MTAAWKVSVHMTAFIPPCENFQDKTFSSSYFLSFSYGSRVKDAHDENDHAGPVHVDSSHCGKSDPRETRDVHDIH